jgi:hypothetical protein
MHIVLGVLGVVVTILVLLHRLADAGIDLGGLNPFLWRRRRSWRHKFDANPVFTLDDPKAVAGLLSVAVAKIDGEMSADEKTAILSEFETTLSLDARQAAELLGSSVYLLGDTTVLSTHLDRIVERGRVLFTSDQTASLLALLERLANVGGGPTASQRSLIESVRQGLAPEAEPQGTWG